MYKVYLGVPELALRGSRYEGGGQGGGDLGQVVEVVAETEIPQSLAVEQTGLLLTPRQTPRSGPRLLADFLEVELQVAVLVVGHLLDGVKGTKHVPALKLLPASKVLG